MLAKTPHRQRYLIVFKNKKVFLNMQNLQQLPPATVVQWGKSGGFSVF
jgi:hypothetical protein